jgi:cell division inhibitor SepF
MARLINNMLKFVGWESEDEDFIEDSEETKVDEVQQPAYVNGGSKKVAGKVVNLHSQAQFKMVVMQPENFDDAKDICDHLKSKKPVVINLEDLEKNDAQRIIDFLSGAVYSLDGNIQKVSSGIFVIAPNNVDIAGDFKDELRNKAVFPWAK